MGKVPYLFTDSEETEETSSSVENVKKKKKFSILKYTTGNIKKKKCKLHSKSEPDDSDHRSRSRNSSRNSSRTSQHVKYKLQSILKSDTDGDCGSTDEDEKFEPPKMLSTLERCLVGRVPRPAGAKPGRGGGVAIVVRKNTVQAQDSSTSSNKRRRKKRLSAKKSY